MAPLIADAFRTRRRESGGAPVVTYYDLASGERTELSAVSLGNWVDKTSNLLVDELLLEPGDQVELDLARTHPAHWVSAIWELACWQVGVVVTLGADSAVRVRVVPPGATWSSGIDPQVVVCSLHPLGLGLPEPPPSGALDYTVEVRTQGDQYAGAPVSPVTGAWREWESRDGAPTEVRRLSQADLVDRPVPPARRLLVRPTTAWAAADALIDAVLSGGSLVVMVGSGHSERVRRIAEQERVEA